MNNVFEKIATALLLVGMFVCFSSFDDNVKEASLGNMNFSYEGADQVILVQDVLKESIYYNIDSDIITQAKVSKAQKALMHHLNALKPYLLDSMHLNQLGQIKEMSAKVGVYHIDDRFSALNRELSTEAFDFYRSLGQVDLLSQTVERRVVNQLVLLNRLTIYYGLSTLGVDVAYNQVKLNAMMHVVHTNATRLVVDTEDEDLLAANATFNAQWSAFYKNKSALKNLEMSPLEVYTMTTEMLSELQIIKERYKATAPLYVFDSKRVK